MWWFLTQFFRHRGRQEHHAMKMEDFQLCKNDEGMEFVKFTEGPRKARQSGLQGTEQTFSATYVLCWRRKVSGCSLQTASEDHKTCDGLVLSTSVSKETED